MKGEEGAGGGDSLLSLSLEFSSIDHGPPKKKPMPELPAARPELSKETLGGGAELPPLPAVDVSKMPVRGKPMELVPMVHERNGWPCHTLFDRASWALHLAQLETHNRKPGMRVIIAKAETHGPKTTPYTIYVMHIKTAFSVRGISRRFSEFKDLDEALRAVKRSAPTLPRKKTWGKMSPKFITERKRQLQAYIEAILSDPTCANSDPFRNFLGTHGHPIEQEILKRYSNGVHGLAQDGHRTALITPWRLATGTRVEAIEELVQRCRAARDVRQEARALNQLGIMESQNGRRAEAINAMRQAFMCCRQLDDADGLLSCALSWASIHAHFGELKVAEQRLHEAESMAAEAGAISGQAWCHLLQALIKASQGLIAAAAKEAVMAGELFSNADDTGHAALAQFTLGGLLLHCGEVRQAVEVLESSLLLRRRARDTLGLGESLSLLGQAFAEIGYQLHAMDYFDQALALCQEMGNRHGEAICLRHLGRVHHLHGDHHEALSALDKSLTLCLRRDDAEGQAQCHESMAGVHLDLGDVRLAVQHLEESLALYTNCQVASRAMPTAAGESGEDGETGALEGIAGRLVGGEDEGDLIAAAGGGMQAEVQPGGGERAEQEEKGGKEESDVQRVSNKLQGARTLIKQANVAYEDYDQALRRAQAGAGAVPPAGESGGDDGGVDLGTAHRKPLLIDVIRGKKGEAGSEPAGMGGDVVLAPSGREHSKGKGGGPKFPLKFKMKVPGQDMSSHFKFLQSWTVHRKYYQTSDEADPTDPQASERADRA